MKSEIVLTGTATELSTAYATWVEAVPPSERHRIAELMRKHDVATLTGINALCIDVIASIFAGTLSPVVATAARPWVELMTVNIHAMNAKQGTSDHASDDVVAALLDMKAKAKITRATYRELEVHNEAVEESDPLAMPDRILIEGGG